MQSENLLSNIYETKAKLVALIYIVLKDPTKNIKNLNQYKQVKKIVKTLNEPSLNQKWKKVNEGYKLYNYLYRKRRGKLNNGKNE